MPTNTTNYNLIKPTDEDNADISAINTNMDIIDTAMININSNKETVLKMAVEKDNLADIDTIPLLDSDDNNQTKRISFANIKTAIRTYFDTLYNYTAIANDLTTNEEGSALDATQGKVLAEKISSIVINKNTAKKDQVLVSNGDGTSAFMDIKVMPKFKKVTFTSSGTWIVPEGVTQIMITACGGGGGGAGGAANGMAGNGQPTTFGSYLSLAGGYGANGPNAGAYISGDITKDIYAGAAGQGAYEIMMHGYGGYGGSGLFPATKGSTGSAGQKGEYGSGGAGGRAISGYDGGGGGGAAQYVIDKIIEVTPNEIVNIKIGAGGTYTVNGQLGLSGGNGGDGILIIKWMQ